MGKKILKTKEPIKIRFKNLANGSKSIYLDYYQNEKRQYRFLKLYLNPQKDPITKAENEKVLRLAEKLKSEIYLQMLGDGGDLKTNFKKEKVMLLDFVKECADNKEGNTKSTYMTLCVWLNRYVKRDMLLSKVDKTFCLGFVAFLQGQNLKKNTIKDYTDKFKACLNVAKRKKKIKENPFDDFLREEKPQREATERFYLTENELVEFITADISENVKNAYLFSCFTGLRYSDIISLEWGNIGTENGKMFVFKKQQKTKEYVKVYLNDNAIKVLPQQGTEKDKVFNLPTLPTINYKLRIGAKQVGINKYLSFHTARHTYATLLITKGADLYVVSKLLGHKKVSTTEIYAKIIDQKKAEAVELLNGII